MSSSLLVLNKTLKNWLCLSCIIHLGSVLLFSVLTFYFPSFCFTESFWLFQLKVLNKLYIDYHRLVCDDWSSAILCGIFNRIATYNCIQRMDHNMVGKCKVIGISFPV